MIDNCVLLLIVEMMWYIIMLILCEGSERFMEYYAFWIIGYLVSCIVFGLITRHVAQSKGYEGGFAWGFWLGLIGLLVVGFRPNKPVEEKKPDSVYLELCFPASGTAVVDPKGGSIPLYSRPDKNNCSAWIPANTKFQIIGFDQENGWVKILYANEPGYVKKDGLKILEMEVENPVEEKEPQNQKSDSPEILSAQNIADKLQLLAKLHAEGLLTDEEYQQKKKDILAKM